MARCGPLRKPRLEKTPVHPAQTFHESDRATLLQRFRDHPFATLTVNGNDAPLIAQAPVLVSADGLSLRMHLSRANPLHERLAAGAAVKVVAHGPHAYVSPDWYGVPDQVPTWNYLTAEAICRGEAMSDEECAALLDDLSAHFEAGLAPKPPWTRAKMTPAVFARMLAAISGWRLGIETLRGVTKLNQNKPPVARAGVIQALETRPHQDDRAIAAAMTALP